MANENKPNENPGAGAKNVVNDRPQMPAKGAAVPAYKVETDASGEEKIVTGNMTRDAIISFQRGKFMEQGKSVEEATDLAVKRGFEMVKDPSAQPAPAPAQATQPAPQPNK